MNEYAAITGPSEVRIERLLPGPIERVWDYLTDSQKRGTWLASGPMELRVGGRVELTFRHSNLDTQKAPTPDRLRPYEEGKPQVGEITRLDPPRLLSLSWGDPGNSEVTFELTPQGDQVHLVITHRRLANRQIMKWVAGGWHSHLTILLHHLMGTSSLPFWTIFTDLEAEYEKRLRED
jgi:uncharacterized protein YndB with AHSA1/START domain